MSQRVTSAYAALADTYISLFGSTDKSHADDLALISAHLGRCTGPVVDAGCGPGHMTAHLASLGVDAFGMDLVPEFISYARDTHPGVRFDVGSLLNLGATSGSLAGVLAWYSLIHLEPTDTAIALAEFHRVLADDGVLVLGFFTGESVEPFAHKVTTAYFWPVDEMALLVRDCGFLVEGTHSRSETGVRPHCALIARKPALANSA